MCKRIFISEKQLNTIIKEEVVADGNAEHNPYAKRIANDMKVVKKFLQTHGKDMLNIDNGKVYRIYYNRDLSMFLGKDYCNCMLIRDNELYGSIYVKPLSTFKEIIATPQFDSRGKDNQL